MNRKGKIYYRCADPKSPYIGGVKVMYEHVDILNRHEFDAYILHDRKGFRSEWFDNDTKITYVRDIKLNPQDFLVFPEVNGKYYVNIKKYSQHHRIFTLKFKSLARELISNYINPNKKPQPQKVFMQLFSTPAKKVIFNQGCYLTFDGLPINNDRLITMYNDKDIAAIIVVSEDSKNYLRYTFPKMRIFRVHNSFNTDLFFFQAEKKKQICFRPWRNFHDAVQVINILKQRHALDGFKFFPIENMPQVQLAEIMRESLIYLSFGYHEGFSLPSAEAMACGCIVIGYHGRGGKEYFDPQFCYPVDTGDVISFAKTIESVVTQYRMDPSILIEKGLMASKYITETYSHERQTQDVLETWREIFACGLNKSRLD